MHLQLTNVAQRHPQFNSPYAGTNSLSATGRSKEAYEFTQINRSVSAGLSISGKRWRRANDGFGIGAIVNPLSQPARTFFAAGGLGLLIGDGQLNYRNEKIFETRYSIRLNTFLKLTLDYQHIGNPAYNHDRGPVSVYSVRLRFDRSASEPIEGDVAMKCESLEVIRGSGVG